MAIPDSVIYNVVLIPTNVGCSNLYFVWYLDKVRHGAQGTAAVVLRPPCRFPVWNSPLDIAERGACKRTLSHAVLSHNFTCCMITDIFSLYRTGAPAHNGSLSSVTALEPPYISTIYILQEIARQFSCVRIESPSKRHPCGTITERIPSLNSGPLPQGIKSKGSKRKKKKKERDW